MRHEHLRNVVFPYPARELVAGMSLQALAGCQFSTISALTTDRKKLHTTADFSPPLSDKRVNSTHTACSRCAADVFVWADQGSSRV